MPGANKLNLQSKEDKMKTQLTRTTKSFAEDDPVWVKNFSGEEKWLAGIIVKRVGKVNYHVVICGEDKVLHRHVNQLVARVPKLGVQEDDFQSTADIDITQREQAEARQRENVRRSSRARERPVWTKDYHMSAN